MKLCISFWSDLAVNLLARGEPAIVLHKCMRQLLDILKQHIWSRSSIYGGGKMAVTLVLHEKEDDAETRF
jgi:hypothetical protein